MKIMEQYVTAIGRKLPLRSREDIKKELRTLLLDDIESRYGDNPTEEQVKETIQSFGSPREVAKKYIEEYPVIGEGFSELYFLILKIMLAGFAVAYTTIFIIDVIQNNLSGLGVSNGILQVIFRTFSTFLSGTGFVTLIFICINRIVKKKNPDIDGDWTPDELQSVQLDKESESLVESIISIAFLFILSLLIVFYPQIITTAENLFGLSGITLGHRIDINAFKPFGYILAALWTGEIIIQFFVVKIGKNNNIMIARTIISVLELVLFLILIINSKLYTYENGFIGFKLIFLIVLIVNFVESGGQIVKLVRNSIAENT